MRKHTVRAIHDEDLHEFLESIGIRQSIEAGRIPCHVCGQTLTIDTVQAVLPINNKIAAVCSQPDCIKKIEAVTRAHDE